MNPLFNPVLFASVARSYLFDTDRVWRASREELERYRDNAFKRVVKHAFNVPLYYKKYRAVGIKLSDIDGIKDIGKLPVVSKDDFRNASLNDLLPVGSDKNGFSMVSTSGSTGKPVTLFTEPYTMFKTLIGFIRVIKEYGISWRKTRMSIIADLSAESAEEAYFTGTAIPSLKPIFSLDNMQTFHVGEDPENILKKMERFNPEFIGGYPGTLKILAILKNRGKGENIRPRWIGSSGAILDDYTRKYIEDAFDARVFDVYGATECSPIAFECRDGNYHIQSDLVNLEFVDKYNNPVSPGKPANIIVTRLFGRGTPVVRYSGISDLVVPSDKECGCGMITPLIEKIEGRRVDAIVLPDGKIIPPSSFTGIPYKVMRRFNTKKIEQFQIIQHDYNRVEILAVVDKRHEEPKIEVLFEALKEAYEKVLGKEVNVEVREVREISTRRDGTVTPPPVVISKVKKE
ncbi:MAG TPA: phenylacetate--CoA ligase family protein [Thermoplasmatales archaeon]|nr:phenylacetate--CoA ligase family protein [Thermoplasmatales archaeon]